MVKESEDLRTTEMEGYSMTRSYKPPYHFTNENTEALLSNLNKVTKLCRNVKNTLTELRPMMFSVSWSKAAATVSEQ